VYHVPRFLRIWEMSFAILLASASIGTAMASDFSRGAHGNPAALPRGCASCHVGHGSRQTPMLPATEVETCLLCHGDAMGKSEARNKGLLGPAAEVTSVAGDFRKPSRHPLGDARRSRSGRAYPKASSQANVVSSFLLCTDCHDPHYEVKSARRGKSDTARAKEMVDARGTRRAEYELCYRCHGSEGRASRGGEDIRRLLRPGNPSFHPVEATGRNSDVPSLVAPYTEQSRISCTDCHGSEQAGGTRGPHGSAFEPILKAHFGREDGRPESAYEYALCYRCHNRSVVLSPAGFPEHREHVVDAKTSCRTCHNSHGSTQYPHLIDFDTRTVFANSKGQLRYRDLGVRHGSCGLRCHGRDHDEEDY